MNEAEWKRLARLIVSRRIQLGMKTTKALAEASQLTPRALGDLENGRRDNYSAGTKAAIEQALGWESGSIDNIVSGGEPIMKSAEGLPRGAYESHIIGALVRDIPTSTGSERMVLTSARNRLVHGRTDFTAEETAALQRFIENSELKTLHARIDWLPRPSQLEISARVDELLAMADDEIASAGITSEDEVIPAHLPQPNPLPYAGIRPELQGDDYATHKQEPRSSTPSTIDRSASRGTEGSEPPMNAGDKPADLNTANQGSNVVYPWGDSTVPPPDPDELDVAADADDDAGKD